MHGPYSKMCCAKLHTHEWTATVHRTYSKVHHVVLSHTHEWTVSVCRPHSKCIVSCYITQICLHYAGLLSFCKSPCSSWQNLKHFKQYHVAHRHISSHTCRTVYQHCCAVSDHGLEETLLKGSMATDLGRVTVSKCNC